MDKQYSVQFFTKFVEAMQKFCRDYIEFEQAVELSGYLSLEIDNYKKERYVLSEMVHSTGDVISESYCVKAFKTMKRLPTRNSDLDFVLRDNTNTRRSGGYADSHTSHQNNSSQGHSYRSRISPEETSHYSNFSPVRRNQPSSFSQSSPVHGRDSQDSFKSKSHTMQIQPRHAIQITESHGQKRVHTDETGDSVNKKEKMDTDLESLYNAATNIVCPSETNETDQNDTGSTAMAESGSANSESVRLPLTDIVAIKEENEVILLDDEGGGPSHMDNAQGNNSNLDSNMLDNSLVSSDMFGSSVSRSEGNASTSSVSNETATSVQETLSSAVSERSSVMQSWNVDHSSQAGVSASLTDTYTDLLSQPGSLYNSGSGKHSELVKARFKCNRCNFQTAYRYVVERHQRKHTGEFFRCHLCTCKFFDKYQLSFHLKGHRGELECRYCGQMFSSTACLYYHEKKHKLGKI